MRAVTQSTPEPDSDDSGESARSRDEKKALQRKHILEAARDVFFRDGFVHANLDEVAQRASVAKGTLYRYFENKGELYVAVLSHNGAIFEQRMREAAASAPEPAEQIRRLGRFYYEHWTSHPEYFRIFWALENQEVIGELPPAVVAEITKLWDECLRILADVIRGGVERGAFRPCDEWVMANVLWTASNGMIQNEIVPSRRATLHGHGAQELFEGMVDLVVWGLRA
jgi:AcrR family transcriptional regulator